MSAGVRKRLWSVLDDWYAQLHRGNIVMTWADKSANGGLGLVTLGEPPKQIIAHDAALLVRRPLPDNEPI